MSARKQSKRAAFAALARIERLAISHWPAYFIVKKLDKHGRKIWRRRTPADRAVGHHGVGCTFKHEVQCEKDTVLETTLVWRA